MVVMSLPEFLRSKGVQVPDGEDLDEAGKLSDVIAREIPDDEIVSYFDKKIGEPELNKKTGEPKMKDGNPVMRSKLTRDEKDAYPYIHGENIPIVNQDGQKYDLNKLAKSIRIRPKELLKKNKKMEHSGTRDAEFYTVGVPALTGLAYDESENKFVVINTCPGAGSCKALCYARKGGYIQWKSSSLFKTRTLNYLYNDPEGFMTQLESEIRAEENNNNLEGLKTIIRWHDAGDFFSNQYLDLAYKLARKFPNVDFYAYTKLSDVATKERPSNFKTNFSLGALPSEERKIDKRTVKNSRVVPEKLFKGLIKSVDNKWVHTDLEKLKKKIASRYKVDVNSLLSYEEMLKVPEDKDNKNKWNVIVMPGEGDDSANREDVLTTFLLMH